MSSLGSSISKIASYFSQLELMDEDIIDFGSSSRTKEA
jgi:hypothetical protein